MAAVVTLAPPSGGGALVRRVVPSYQSRVADALGVSEAVMGAILIALAAVVFGIRAFTSTGGSAILTGISITAHQLLALLSLIFNMALIAAASTGITKEKTRPANVDPTFRQAVDVLAILLALILSCCLVWSLILSSLALFYGCCKQSSGAKYVVENKDKTNSETDGNGNSYTSPAENPTRGAAVLQVTS